MQHDHVGGRFRRLDLPVAFGRVWAAAPPPALRRIFDLEQVMPGPRLCVVDGETLSGLFWSAAFVDEETNTSDREEDTEEDSGLQLVSLGRRIAV